MQCGVSVMKDHCLADEVYLFFLDPISHLLAQDELRDDNQQQRHISEEFLWKESVELSLLSALSKNSTILIRFSPSLILNS
jgi:hypothetical protein